MFWSHVVSSLLLVVTDCTGRAGGDDNPLVHVGGGVIASLAGSVLGVPIEVIRQRQMVQTAGEGSYTVRFHPFS